MGHEFCGFTAIAKQTKTTINQGIVTTAGPVTVKPQLFEDGSGFRSGVCLFIATKAACVNDEKQIISPTATTPATAGVVVANNFLTPATNTKPLYTYTISNYSGFSTTTTSIIKNYPIPAGKTELTLYLQFIPDKVAVASTLSYVLNIGGVEYPVV